MLVLTFLAKYLLPVMLLVVPWFWLNRQRLAALQVTLSVILAELVAQVIKHAFPTLRPFQVAGADTPDIFFTPNGNVDPAFPSGHAAMSFALATAVFLHHKKLSIWFYLGAILICVSRVLADAHFWKDIGAGALVGIGSALVVNRLVTRWKRN